MMVTQVAKHGEMFDNCGYPSKWEWVSVNGSQISLVGGKCEKLSTEEVKQEMKVCKEMKPGTHQRLVPCCWRF